MLSPEQWVDAHIDMGVASRFLRLAAINGEQDTVERLLGLGVDPNRHYQTDARDLPDSNPGKTALHYAAGYGRSEIIRVLLQAGALPNAVRLHGDTPLLEWVRGRSGSEQADPSRNYHASAVLLLQAGANPQISTHSASGSAWESASTKGVLPALLRAYAEVASTRQALALTASTPPVVSTVEEVRRL